MNVITKTRGDAPPFGKPRVIICPSLYRGGEAEVTDALLGAADVAVSYVSGWYPVEEEDIDRLFDGARIAVSIQEGARLSCLCLNDEQLLARVAERGIPILPILLGECMDGGVREENYKRLLGNRQYLLYGEEGFEESLRAYLSAHVADDQTRRLVAGAFRGRLFLSYRKRDGAEASRLVRLLHRLPDMEDVAVWIDDYLTPGEDFSDEIREALLGSNGVILCVTPNLLEQGNYVQRVEYPLAHERDIPVFPVVMAEMEDKLLRPYTLDYVRRMYPDIDALGLFRPDSLAELRRALERILPPPAERTAEKSYLLGLGYLSGIEVEQSLSRALTLLEEAAEGGEPRAAEKLAELYGGTPEVAYSEEDRLRWLRRAAELREAAVEGALEDGEEVSDDEAEIALRAWRRLENALYDGRRYVSAEEAADRVIALAEKTVRSPLTLDFYRAEHLCHRGRCARRSGRPTEAEKDLAESLALWRRLVAQKRSLSHRQGLAEALLEQATVLNDRGRAEEALRPALEALALYDSAQEDNNHTDRDRLLHAMHVLCDLYVALGLWRELEDSARRFLREAERLCLQSETPYRRTLLQSALAHMGRWTLAQGDEERSCGYYRRALEVARPLAEETKDAAMEAQVFYAALGVGNALRRSRRFGEAVGYYEEARSVAERIRALAGYENFAECLCLEAMNHLCTTYYSMDRKEEGEGLFDEAALRYRRLLSTETVPKLKRDFADLLYFVALKRGGDEAFGLYSEAVELLRPLTETDPAALAPLLRGMHGKISVLRRAGRIEEAVSLAEEAVALSRGRRRNGYERKFALQLLTDFGELKFLRDKEGDKKAALDAYHAVLTAVSPGEKVGIAMGKLAEAAEELAYLLSDLSALTAVLPHLEGTSAKLAEHHERAMEVFLAAGMKKEAARAALTAIDHRESAFRREMTEENRAALARTRAWHREHTAPPTATAVLPREGKDGKNGKNGRGKTPSSPKTGKKKPSLWQRLFGKGRR